MSQNILSKQQISTLRAVPAGQAKDHRKHRRLKYPVVQMLAPTSSEARLHQLPSPNDFQKVRCRDISQNGIAFVWEGPPHFREVVLALGAQPETIFVRGRVVRKEPLNDGSGWYLVGCEFIERVQLPQ